VLALAPCGHLANLATAYCDNKGDESGFYFPSTIRFPFEELKNVEMPPFPAFLKLAANLAKV
jgi:hypothetical protein